mmetsp:Transcript_27546/g.83365  ORF Transcript_27546/g.83365 Transcript_27546/m.83365 type:complete len:100 (+) Transcript_27546:323-622(+)
MSIRCIPRTTRLCGTVAGLADESHRVLCRDWIHSSPPPAAPTPAAPAGAATTSPAPPTVPPSPPPPPPGSVSFVVSPGAMTYAAGITYCADRGMELASI